MTEVQTVSGPVAAQDLGVVLPHEHLFNDLSSVRAEPAYASTRAIVDRAVAPEWQFLLRQDPYCCADNVAAKGVDEVIPEALAFTAAGV